MGLRFADHLTALRADSARIATLAGGDVSGRVHACPDWDLRLLVEHVGEVQCSWTQIVRARGTRPDIAPPPPVDGDLSGWYRRMSAGLLDAFAVSEPDWPCWSWWSDSATVADAARRQSHEAAIHRWDAEAAAGLQPSGLPIALAGDGVAELLDVFVGAADGPWTEAPCSFAFVAADSPGAWGLTCTTGAAPAYAEGRPPAADLSVVADASELDLLLWARRAVTDLRFEITGHTKHLAHLRSYLDLS